MDEKNLEDNIYDKIAKFMLITFVRLVIIGFFALVFCLFPIMLWELFTTISKEMGTEIEIDRFYSYIIIYSLTHIILYYFLILKKDKSSNDRL